MTVYEAECLVKKLFIATDGRFWDKVEKLFTEELYLDYQTFNGDSPAIVKAEDIVYAWSSFLPGFDYTHHQIGNMLTKITDDKAEVFCYGTTTLFMNAAKEKFLTIVGSYTFDIVAVEGMLKIKGMVFNFKFKIGNAGLTELARKKVAERTA